MHHEDVECTHVLSYSLSRILATTASWVRGDCLRALEGDLRITAQICYIVNGGLRRVHTVHCARPWECFEFGAPVLAMKRRCRTSLDVVASPHDVSLGKTTVVKLQRSSFNGLSTVIEFCGHVVHNQITSIYWPERSRAEGRPTRDRPGRRGHSPSATCRLSVAPVIDQFMRLNSISSFPVALRVRPLARDESVPSD